MLVVLIFSNLYVKKRSFIYRNRISGWLNQWISEALMNDDVINVSPPRWLKNYLRKEPHRQYVTDNLINIKQNISGSVDENISALYKKLGLREDSVKKLHSRLWYLKARGIYELYMMGQEDMLPDIQELTNSRNEQVRMEAQTAIVGFKGFNGLSFLKTLIYPINEWQQLKLLAQLSNFDPGDMEELALWLSSENEYVQLFALKLTDIYQQFHLHDIAAMALRSPHEHLRSQAIKTLGRIPNEFTASILQEQYSHETYTNKKSIFKEIGNIGGDADLPFLSAQLADPDDGIKLEAGRALARCNKNGRALFESSILGNEVLMSVAAQIKYELAK